MPNENRQERLVFHLRAFGIIKNHKIIFYANYNNGVSRGLIPIREFARVNKHNRRNVLR